MDSRFRGNDSGEGGILSARIGRRRKGGNRAAGEIPIYIGMVKIENDGRRKGGNRTAAGKRKLRGRSKLRRTCFAPDKCQGRVGEAKMTAGRRDFVGENRAAAERRESGGGGDSDLHRNGKN